MYMHVLPFHTKYFPFYHCCLLPSGYRHIRLLTNTGEPLENATLFVHVAITNKKGGGVSNYSVS